MIGRTLSHYRIIEKIGSGGMGIVYRAVDERLNRDVALKVLPVGALVDETSRKNFRKEALFVSQLNHPNIATVHDFDTHEGIDFLVMEYISGVTMQQKVSSGPLQDREIMFLAPQIAQGLAAAHDQGIIHCDLKPGNLRITSDGRVKILDFGLARRLYHPTDQHLSDTLTDTSTTAGTLPYMAPEQLRGEKMDARCDIYALGVVLYEMATGQRPFPETWGPKLIDAILNQAPPPPIALNRRIAPGLESIILKAMDKEPDRRYQSAREMSVDLIRLTGPVPLVAPPRPRRRGLRRAVAVGVGVAVVAALLVAADVGGWRSRLFRGGGSDRIEALAVLPMENLLGDPSQDYLADGMTDALIADLAKIKTLRVPSRTSVLRYKGARKPLPEIARELNVDAVVEGTVLHTENRVRVTAQLIHIATDRHLWAESYDRDMGDVLALQSEVAGAIAHEIEAKLDPQAEQRRGAGPRLASPEAYEAYLKGRYHWYKPTQEDLRKSVEYFERAIQIDAASAASHAGLAESYMALVTFGGMSEQEAYPKAKAAVTRALQIDDALAEGHGALALLRFLFEWDWVGAEKAFKRALELDPDNATTRRSYASFLEAMNRTDEALREIGRAQELDPLSILTNVEAGRLHLAARRYDEAIAQLRNTLEMDQDYAITHDALAWAYLGKGMPEDAIHEFKAAIALPGNNWTMVVGLGYAYAVSARMAEARQIIEQLMDLSTRRYVSAAGIATIYAGLGDKDQAFEWLQKGCAGRETSLVMLNGQAAFDVLRPDPRFEELMRKVGLPPRARAGQRAAGVSSACRAEAPLCPV